MKTYFNRFLLLLLFVLPGVTAQASHYMGVDITYICNPTGTDTCIRRFFHSAYFDCSTYPSGNPSPSFTWIVPPGCPTPVAVGAPVFVYTGEVTPINPACASTRCSTPGATINGSRVVRFYQDYNFCPAPSSCIYNIEWYTCCRNAAITNISYGSGGIYTGATTINLGIGCNSSPQFANPPVPYICNGQPFTFNQGAFDADGDSLSYSLGPCLSNAGTSVLYNPGYTATQPLGPGWNVTINPVTGDINILPTPGSIEVAVICVYVTEWRGGVQIGQVVRDMQVTVIPCPSNTVPTHNLVGVTGGSIIGPRTVQACAGSNVCMDIRLFDPDSTTQDLVLYWSGGPMGATFTSLFPLGMIDTIYTTAGAGSAPVGRLCFTPPAAGTYNFLVTAVDSACPILGRFQATYTIFVSNGLVGAYDSALVSGCNQVDFFAYPGSLPGPYTYLWTGDGNLTGKPYATDSAFTHTYPAPGTYYYTLTITNSLGCTVTITDSIIVPNSAATANAGTDITFCSGFPVTIGTPPIPGQTYSWSPTTGLSSSTVSDPTLTLINTTGGPITYTYTVTANNGICTAIDEIEVTVNPAPTATIAGPVTMCLGDTVTLTAGGGTAFLWSTGDTTSSIQVSPSVSTTYTVIVNSGGCASLPVSHTVTVVPPPVGSIVGPDSVCMWGSATLTALGGTTFLWSTGATTSTITISGINQDTTLCVVPFTGPCVGAPVCFTVHPYPQPVADFTNNTVCAGLTTTFTDLSSTPTGSIIGWDWNFGDPGSSANTSTLTNPSHTFTATGIYNVTLIITNSHGCKDTVVHPVTVLALPVADFSLANVCDGQSASFTDLSSLGGGTISAWLWNFGDGTTSTLQNPTHVYSGPGLYNVTLTVTGSNGCTDDVTKSIIIHPNPVPDFSFTNYCFNTITQFTDLSTITDPLGTVLLNWAWDFGDPGSGAANTSTDRNPIHNYSGPGFYTVTLTVTSSVGCSTTITRSIYIDPIPFPTAVNDTVCAGKQARVGVSGVPAFATQIEWYFSQFGGSPFFIGGGFDTPPINTVTTYWVSMRDSAGCESVRFPVYVYLYPTEFFEINIYPRQTEIPNAIVNFTTTADTDIVALFWDFGDGTTSTDRNPVHQYETEGVYDVSVRLIDENGCEYLITYQEYITVIEKIRLFVPNTFTPNGDGLNDEFSISGTLIKEINIQIYDRWGKILFESSDLGFAWKGLDQSGDNCPEGSYVYVINGLAYDGTKINKKGSVTIIR